MTPAFDIKKITTPLLIYTHKPRSLFLHLAIAVLIKFVVLIGLWWFFIRDSSVVVNADFMATHIGVPANSEGVSK